MTRLSIILLILILNYSLYLLIPPAFNYSNAWNSQSHPITGVTVTLRDGSKIEGDLRRNFNLERVIQSADGMNRILSDKQIQLMEIPAFTQGENELFISEIFKNWRSFFLPALLIAFYATGLTILVYFAKQHPTFNS